MNEERVGVTPRPIGEDELATIHPSARKREGMAGGKEEGEETALSCGAKERKTPEERQLILEFSKQRIQLREAGLSRSALFIVKTPVLRWGIMIESQANQHRQNGMESMSEWVIGASLWVAGGILVAELVRDVRHVLAHLYPKLMPKHQVHHRVFRSDLSVVSPTIYRQAQWQHDVPESLTMGIATGLLWGISGWVAPEYCWPAGVGVLYSLGFLLGGIARAQGWSWAPETDLTHRPGPFDALPHPWWVNRTYHWRHHFDDPNAYFCGTLTLVDRIMGTSLSLKGKTIAVTGASGSLGRSLLQRLEREGAKLIALSSKPDAVIVETPEGTKTLRTEPWQVGQEAQLQDLLESVDILILNHGINVHGARTPAAIQQSYEINTFSHWRLLELFLTTVRTNADIACKEVWVNTSEAEVLPAVSPLYELSKRSLGDLITLRRLDAPCVIRKLILGPFKSNLNPIGVMSSDWVADKIIQWAKRDVRNIIVTIDPLTYLLLPLKEWWVSTYFTLFTDTQIDG